MTLKNIHVIVREEDEKKKVEDALKLFESTQIDKDRIYNDVLDIETQIKRDKEEIKESIIILSRILKACFQRR
jgi:hypothetical protein